MAEFYQTIPICLELDLFHVIDALIDWIRAITIRQFDTDRFLRLWLSIFAKNQYPILIGSALEESVYHQWTGFVVAEGHSKGVLLGVVFHLLRGCI